MRDWFEVSFGNGYVPIAGNTLAMPHRLNVK